jgi:hypothetical protein
MGIYRIARRLSAPAGVVEAYLGVEATTQQPVVVKRLVGPWNREAAAFAHRFLAQPAAEPGLPGLAQWLEVGYGRDTVWLVQALHEGESLRHALNALAQSKGFIAPNEALAVVGLATKLLAALHERTRRALHGDLCASTISLAADGQVLLLDAGISAALTPSTTAGPARSEVWSLSPEQFTEPSTPATDIFRLGLLLYELSVGQPLFAAADPLQAMVLCQRFIGLERERIKQVPEPWHSLLRQMLAANPRERPTAAEVDAVLHQAAARAGWKSAQADVARLFARAFVTRQSLAELAQGGAQELTLGPLPPAPPTPVAPPEADSKSTTGSFEKLPAVPEPAVVPATTPPSAIPGAVVGRITTRKMTRSELEAAQQADVVALQPALPAESSAPKDLRLGELLVEKGLITRAQYDEARTQATTYGGSLADALSSLGATDEDTIVTVLADLTRTPHTTSMKLGAMAAPAEALARVPLELARELDLVPLGLKGGTQLMVAMKDPMDATALERLKTVTGLRSIVAVRGGERAIRKTRNRFYTGQADERPDWLEDSADRATAPRFEPPRVTPAASPAAERSTAKTLELELPGSEVQTLGGPAARLVTSLLSLVGERGHQLVLLADLAAALATNLGVTATRELDRVHFATIAVGVANLLEGRPRLGPAERQLAFGGAG